MRKLSILGSTGSIGTQTLEVCRNNPEDFEVRGLCCGSNIELLYKQILEFKPEVATVDSEEKALELKKMLPSDIKTTILSGHEGTLAVAALDSADTVVGAMVGISGLEPTYNAILKGKDIALANKETLVTGGDVIMPLVKEKGVALLPVDSEHSALDELISNCGKENVSKLVITASGGPFRNTELDKLWEISPQTAANHPTWKMGPKISIDSSTLANKGLEVIEAHYLFGFEPERIEVVIHPQSVVHSMVRTTSGQVYAQMSPPDMVFPIMRALTGCHFERAAGKELDFTELDLNFRKPDFVCFPFVSDAFECIRSGGSYPIAYNAADEAAVALFMQGKLKYPQIHTAVNRVLQLDWSEGAKSLEEIPLIEKRAYDAVLSGEL